MATEISKENVAVKFLYSRLYKARLGVKGD